MKIKENHKQELQKTFKTNRTNISQMSAIHQEKVTNYKAIIINQIQNKTEPHQKAFLNKQTTLVRNKDKTNINYLKKSVKETQMLDKLQQLLLKTQTKEDNFQNKLKKNQPIFHKKQKQHEDLGICQSKKFQNNKSIQTRHNKCASIGLYNHNSKNIQFSKQNLNDLDQIRQKYLNEYEKTSNNVNSLNVSKKNSQIRQQPTVKNYGLIREKYSSLSQATRNTVSKSMYVEDQTVLNSNLQKKYEKHTNRIPDNDFNAYTFHNTQSNQQGQEESINRYAALDQMNSMKKYNDAQALQSYRQPRIAQKNNELSNSYLDKIPGSNYSYSKISSNEEDKTQKTMSKLKRINELNQKINDRIRKIINNFETK